MKKSELKGIIKECIKEIIKENSQPPTNWRSGFKDPKSQHPVDTPLRLKQGEEPFQLGGKWYLYVYDEREGDDVVYDFSSDMIISYNEFEQMVNNMKKSIREGGAIKPKVSYGDSVVIKQNLKSPTARKYAGKRGVVKRVDFDGKGADIIIDGKPVSFFHYEFDKSVNENDAARKAARRKDPSLKTPAPKVQPSGKSKAKAKDVKQGRKPVKV